MIFNYDKTRYLYLASPYSHDDPAVRQWRYEQAVDAGAMLAKAGIWTFGPIAHSHEMCLRHEMPYTFEFWDEWNRVMIRRSGGLLVLRMDGWETSRGIKAELAYAHTRNLPVDYMEWLHKCPVILSPPGEPLSSTTPESETCLT